MGKAEGGHSCLKYLMFFFNGLFFVCGLVILAIGLWVRFDKRLDEAVDQETADLLHNGAYVIIAFGAFITVVTFLGCCGAIRENQCMLATFFIILLIILVALVAAGIYVFVKKDDAKEWIKKFVDETADQDTKDQIEREFDCCVTYRTTQCPQLPGKKLCSDAVFDEVESRLPIVGGVALGVAFVMVLGMIFSMVLCCSVRKSDYAV